MRHDATRAERRLENAAETLIDLVRSYMNGHIVTPKPGFRLALAEYDDAYAHRHDKDEPGCYGPNGERCRCMDDIPDDADPNSDSEVTR